MKCSGRLLILVLVGESFSLTPAFVQSSSGESFDANQQNFVQFEKFWAGPYFDIAEVKDSSHPKQSFDQTAHQSFRLEKKVPAFGYTSKHFAARLVLNHRGTDDATVYFVFQGPIEKVFMEHYAVEQLIASGTAGRYVMPEVADPLMTRFPTFRAVLKSGENTFYFSEDAVAPHYPVIVISSTDFASYVMDNNMTSAGFFAVNLCLVFAAIVFGGFFSGLNHDLLQFKFDIFSFFKPLYYGRSQSLFVPICPGRPTSKFDSDSRIPVLDYLVGSHRIFFGYLCYAISRAIP